MLAQTLYDKLWADHCVLKGEDGLDLIYIDRQLLHEVTSPQAFEGLGLENRKPFRLDANLAVPDHNVPTTGREEAITDPIAALQLKTLQDNCDKYDIPFISMSDQRQGIVHVIGPEQGATLPGTTIVCGDSHTATHGAFGALAFGIGTSEVELVLASQCLRQKKMRNMRIQVDGSLAPGVTAKDLILYIIGQIGTDGGTGCAIEFCGQAIEELSIEGRMTVCNMAIEAGARVGLVAVDSKTIDYFRGKPFAPKNDVWDLAVNEWEKLKSDPGAGFDADIKFNAEDIAPQVSYGTSPEMVVDIDSTIPTQSDFDDVTKQDQLSNAMKYMDLQEGMPVKDIQLDKVFIGSCTNSRIEDLRDAATIVANKSLAKNIKLALIVPGSGLVKEQAESEGLDKIFIAAGFEWREPGCSMCLAMNDDRLDAGEHCASTSNRNFEGRQGQGGRTHLVSPVMAAAAGIYGHFVDVRDLLEVTDASV